MYWIRCAFSFGPSNPKHWDFVNTKEFLERLGPGSISSQCFLLKAIAILATRWHSYLRLDFLLLGFGESGFYIQAYPVNTLPDKREIKMYIQKEMTPWSALIPATINFPTSHFLVSFICPLLAIWGNLIEYTGKRSWGAERKQEERKSPCSHAISKWPGLCQCWKNPSPSLQQRVRCCLFDICSIKISWFPSRPPYLTLRWREGSCDFLYQQCVRGGVLGLRIPHSPSSGRWQYDLGQ